MCLSPELVETKSLLSGKNSSKSNSPDRLPLIIKKIENANLVLENLEKRKNLINALRNEKVKNLDANLLISSPVSRLEQILKESRIDSKLNGAASIL
jgi:hypothetical protein